MKILVWGNEKDNVLEILAKARELAAGGEVVCLAAGPLAKHAEEFARAGASRVLRLDSPLENVSSGIFTRVVVAAAEKEKPDVLLLGGTKHALEVAPRVAVRLGTGCIPNVTRIEARDGQLHMDHLVYSGNAVATDVCTAKPVVATVAPKAFEAKPGSGQGKVEAFQAEVPSPKVKLRRSEAAQHEKKRIEDAKIIVSGGRGVKKKEDFELIEKLAEAMGGFLGVSRPIAADLKWKTEDHWVGLSGHKVKPQCYVACGISGQIQHLAGMRDSRVIVAINTSEEAPIFKVCDYGVVGDLYKVVPLLTAAVRKAKGR